MALSYTTNWCLLLNIFIHFFFVVCCKPVLMNDGCANSVSVSGCHTQKKINCVRKGVCIQESRHSIRKTSKSRERKRKTVWYASEFIDKISFSQNYDSSIHRESTRKKLQHAFWWYVPWREKKKEFRLLFYEMSKKNTQLKFLQCNISLLLSFSFLSLHNFNGMNFWNICKHLVWKKGFRNTWPAIVHSIYDLFIDFLKCWSGIVRLFVCLPFISFLILLACFDAATYA